MTLTKQLVIGYQCARCGEISGAETEFTADKPEGFYFTLRKVTGGRKHYATPAEVFVCSKECFIETIQYGIGGIVVDAPPIGPATR